MKHNLTKKKETIAHSPKFPLPLYYAHTNRFCVVQENIKPEILKVHTELARSVHLDRALYISLYNDKTG